MATATASRGRNAPRLSKPCEDALDPEVWVRWLDEEICEVSDFASDRLLALGHPLNETKTRALHRWRVEGAYPTIWSADRWITGIAHIQEFFDWCERSGVCPWARGEPPEWAR